MKWKLDLLVTGAFWALYLPASLVIWSQSKDINLLGVLFVGSIAITFYWIASLTVQQIYKTKKPRQVSFEHQRDTRSEASSVVASENRNETKKEEEPPVETSSPLPAINCVIPNEPIVQEAQDLN